MSRISPFLLCITKFRSERNDAEVLSIWEQTRSQTSAVGRRSSTTNSGCDSWGFVVIGFPFPRQQFLEPSCWMIGDPREDVGEPGLRIDVVHFGGDDQAIHGGGARPTRSEPQNNHDLRPRAIPRSSRSAALFDRQTRPSVRNSVKACQRFSIYWIVDFHLEVTRLG